MSDELVVIPPNTDPSVVGKGLIDHINDLNDRVAAIEGGVENIGGPYLPLAGGVMSGGINFGGSVVGNPEDLSQCWKYYDGNVDFGMSVTSNRLNYVTTASDDSHCFRVASTDVGIFNNSGLVIPSGKALTIGGQNSDTRYLSATGGTVTGPILCEGWYADDRALVNKGYVDGLHASAVGPPHTIGDVKYSYAQTDHDGWIRQDGRSVLTLTVEQQAAASLLGFVSTIPDATDAVAMQTTGPMGQVAGSNERVLIKENLPNVALTTTSDGDHRHGMMAVTNNEGNCGFSEMLPEGAYPASKVWNRQAEIATANNQYTPIVGSPMEFSGPHSHTVSLPGSAAPLNIVPKSYNVNSFVYLGAA